MTGTLLMLDGDGPDRRGWKVAWGYPDKPIVVLAYVGLDTFSEDVASVDEAAAFLLQYGLVLPEAAVTLIGG